MGVGLGKKAIENQLKLMDNQANIPRNLYLPEKILKQIKESRKLY